MCVWCARTAHALLLGSDGRSCIRWEARIYTHISCSPFIFSSTEITFINAFGQAIKAKHSLCHFYVWNKCYTHTDTHSQWSKDCFFRNKKWNYEKQKRNGDQGTNDGFGNTSIDSDKSCLGSHSMHVYVCFRARALCDNKNVTVLSLLLSFFFFFLHRWNRWYKMSISILLP